MKHAEPAATVGVADVVVADAAADAVAAGAAGAAELAARHSACPFARDRGHRRDGDAHAGINEGCQIAFLPEAGFSGCASAAAAGPSPLARPKKVRW